MRQKPTFFSGVLFVFVFFLLANPAYFLACQEEDDQFTYGEEEMLTLLDTVNSGSWQIDQYQIEFTLDQSGEELARQLKAHPDLLATAQACGNRSFVKSASACMDISSMPLTGVATIYRINGDDTLEEIDELPAQGYLEVMSLNLDHATIDLSLPSNGSVQLAWDDTTPEDFQLASFSATDVGDESAVISLQY